MLTWSMSGKKRRPCVLEENGLAVGYFLKGDFWNLLVKIHKKTAHVE